MSVLGLTDSLVPDARVYFFLTVIVIHVSRQVHHSPDVVHVIVLILKVILYLILNE